MRAGCPGAYGQAPRVRLHDGLHLCSPARQAGDDVELPARAYPGQAATRRDRIQGSTATCADPTPSPRKGPLHALITPNPQSQIGKSGSCNIIKQIRVFKTPLIFTDPGCLIVLVLTWGLAALLCLHAFASVLPRVALASLHAHHVVCDSLMTLYHMSYVVACFARARHRATGRAAPDPMPPRIRGRPPPVAAYGSFR